MFHMDKNIILLERHTLDRILLGVDEKILSKCYKFFMAMEVGEEGVKTLLHAWVRDLGLFNRY